MKRFLKTLKWRLPLVGLVVLCLVMVTHGGVGTAQAGGVDERVACWTSGPLDKDWSPAMSGAGEHIPGLYGFGTPYEYAVDRRDLGGFADGQYELVPREDVRGRADGERLAFFRNFPDLIDYSFYLPGRTGGKDYKPELVGDSKIIQLGQLLEDGSGSGDDLPWVSRKDFLDRKSVALYDNDERVKRFSARWTRPEESGGGLTTDIGALLQDQRVHEIEKESGTVHTAEKGFRRHINVQEVASVEVVHGSQQDCSEGNCTQSIHTTSSPVKITVMGQSRNSNDGEEFDHVVGADVRPFTEEDEFGNDVTRELDVENDRVKKSTLDQRSKGADPYGELAQRDTDRNQILVEIELDPSHRQDYEFQAGPLLGNVELPGMGYTVWTYDNIGGFRDVALNDRESFDLESKAGVLNDNHYGFRQPGMDGSTPRNGAPENVEHVKWPVNIEDLNWYVYELPGETQDEEWSLLWLHEDGGQWLVRSGFGGGGGGSVAALDGDVPKCELEDEEVFRKDQIKCDKGDGHQWGDGDYKRGKGEGAYLPFEGGTTVKGNLLGGGGFGIDEDWGKLVKMGVAVPTDHGPKPGRRMNKFAFLVDEGSKFGVGVDTEGVAGLDRFGAPRRRVDDLEPNYAQFVKAWPSEPINPNQSYLMVVTYYESLSPVHPQDEKRVMVISAGEFREEAVVLPRRYLRRVVCRLLIYPSGIESPVDEDKKFWGGLFGGVIDNVTKVFGSFKGIVASAGKWVIKLPLYGVKKSGEVACVGLGHLDRLTGIEGPETEVEESYMDGEGRIVVNAAARSKREGSEECYKVAAPRVSTCDGGTDLIFKGYCANLPELKLTAVSQEFFDPGTKVFEDGTPPDDRGVRFQEYEVTFTGSGAGDESAGGLSYSSVPTLFGPVREIEDPTANVRYTSGLTAVQVRWDFRWPGVPPEVDRAIHGVVVEVQPDTKAAQGVVPGAWRQFVLPKWVLEDYEGTTEIGEIYDATTRHKIDRLWIGGLNQHGNTGANALVEPAGFYATAAEAAKKIKPMGSAKQKHEYREFVNFVGNLPLAPEFKHTIRVSPYNGRPGEPGFREGPVSDELVLDGEKAACGALETGMELPEGLGERVRAFYECPGQRVFGRVTTDDEFRVGLLELSGTDICDDIFSSTPAILTWDNEVVKRVWLLMQFLGGGVLFSLFVWQGVRMTYDIWIDPQPAIGLRELVPRFLLAIAMMAGSLVMARLILILSSDVTCFVAQVTGMSMWGVIGVTFGSIMDGVTAWMDGVDKGVVGFTLPLVLALWPITVAVGVLILVFVLMMLFLFVKVALGMLMRIAMLAALIAVSPLAFALYASDTTSKFTSWWMKAFLGAACQQVFVLVVIYIGANLIGTYMAAAADGDFQVMIIGLMLALLTLALADSVPKIVNPAGEGMFQTFGKMAGMAGMAAMVVASGGLGAGAGALRGAVAGWQGAGAAVGGGGGGIRMGMAAGGGGGSGGGDQGGGGPGGGPQGGGGGGAPQGPSAPLQGPSGSMAGLNRSTFGPSTGQESQGGPPAVGGGQAPGGRGPGSMLPGAALGGAAVSGVAAGLVPGGRQGGGQPGGSQPGGGQGSQPAGGSTETGLGDRGGQRRVVGSGPGGGGVAPGGGGVATGGGGGAADRGSADGQGSGEEAGGGRVVGGGVAPSVPGEGGVPSSPEGGTETGGGRPGSGPGTVVGGGVAPGGGGGAADRGSADGQGSGEEAGGGRVVGGGVAPSVPGEGGARSSPEGGTETGGGTPGSGPGTVVGGGAVIGGVAAGGQAPGGRQRGGGGQAPGGQQRGGGGQPPGGQQGGGGGQPPGGQQGGGGGQPQGGVRMGVSGGPASGAGGGVEAGGGRGAFGGPSFADRALGALRGAGGGAVSGARSGARFGGQMNEGMQKLSSGRLFIAGRRPGGDTGERSGIGRLGSGREQSNAELRRILERVAGSVAKRKP